MIGSKVLLNEFSFQINYLSDKIREARLGWCGHVMRREDENYMRRNRIMTSEVNVRRIRGRNKKQWGDMIIQDMKLIQLEKEDTGDRKKWRKRICLADSSPGMDYFKPDGDISNI